MSDTSLTEKAIENQTDISFVATKDYVCQIKSCKKLVKRGRSHAHPSVKTFVSHGRGKK